MRTRGGRDNDRSGVKSIWLECTRVLTKLRMKESKCKYSRNAIPAKLWCKWRLVRTVFMKLAILLQAVSSLQVQSNGLSRFNDRKYGTWKARHNIKPS